MAHDVPMRRSRVLAIAARLADGVRRPPGDAGTLVELWHDADAVALLRHVAGLRGPLEWRRDAGTPGVLALRSPILGLEVRAPDPETLADAVEHLAGRVDALLAAAQAEVERAPDGRGLTEVLARQLGRELALAPAGAPPGARFHPADRPPSAAAPSPVDGERRERLRTPEVEDHRPVIPPRPVR